MLKTFALAKADLILKEAEKNKPAFYLPQLRELIADALVEAANFEQRKAADALGGTRR